MEETRADRYEVRSLVRGLQILECLERTKTPMRLTDLANELGVERATLYRYCATLVGLRYLHVDPRTKQYSLGIRVRSLAYAAAAQWPALVLIREFLPTIAERFRGAASFGVLEGDNVLYVERAVASGTLNFHLNIGDRLPAIQTSIGRVLLAFEPEAQVRRILRSVPTQEERDSLFEELRVVREEGLALNLGLIEAGLNSVGVPVYEPGAERPFGALNLAGSAEHLDAQRLRTEVAVALRAFADQISRRTEG